MTIRGEVLRYGKRTSDEAQGAREDLDARHGIVTGGDICNIRSACISLLWAARNLREDQDNPVFRAISADALDADLTEVVDVLEEVLTIIHDVSPATEDRAPVAVGALDERD